MDVIYWMEGKRIESSIGARELWPELFYTSERERTQASENGKTAQDALVLVFGPIFRGCKRIESKGSTFVFFPRAVRRILATTNNFENFVSFGAKVPRASKEF